MTDIVRLMLQDERFDLAGYDNMVVQYASKKGHAEIIRFLLQDRL